MILPKYLRLLFLLYGKGKVRIENRKKYGFTLNDVYMLEAYGFACRLGNHIEITDKGRKAAKEALDEIHKLTKGD